MTQSNENQAVVQFQSDIESQTGALKAVLPEHLPVERFIRASMIAVQSNPGILQADRQSLFTSLQRCAGDGLVPDNKEAALVEFNTNVGTREQPQWVKKIQYMPMVDGVLKRARQSGEVSVITARAVHENDKFDYWVDENGEHLIHRPLFSGDRGAMILVYAMAKMKTGDVIVEPMTMSDIERVKASSKTSSYGPWKDWFDRMALKSALHRLARRLPNSSEIMEMLSRDHWMYDLDKGSSGGRPEPEYYPADKFEENLPAWRAAIESGKRTPDQIVNMVKSKGLLTKAQEKQILSIEMPQLEAATAGDQS